MNVRPLRPHAALLLESKEGKRYVAVSDLHIGLEAELASKGITFKPNLVEEMTAELSGLIDSNKADCVVLLGDVKHAVGTIGRQEWDEIPAFLNHLASRSEVYLVPGNHDGNIGRLIPPSVNVIGSKGMVIDDTLLVHGHSMPSDVRSHISRIVMGHLHPVFLKRGSLLNGERVWIYVQAKKQSLFSEHGSIDVVVVPSFNQYLSTSGPKSHRKSISPIINRIMEHKGGVEKCVIATLDGSVIGDEEILRHII
ncbi:MAG TPA: metallophosphoesterase [Nitrososphaera sp.]